MNGTRNHPQTEHVENPALFDHPFYKDWIVWLVAAAILAGVSGVISNYNSAALTPGVNAGMTGAQTLDIVFAAAFQFTLFGVLPARIRRRYRTGQGSAATTFGGTTAGVPSDTSTWHGLARQARSTDGPNALQCTVCGHVWRTQQALNYHLRKDPGILPSSAGASPASQMSDGFACRLCGAPWQTAAGRDYHLRRDHVSH